MSKHYRTAIVLRNNFDTTVISDNGGQNVDNDSGAKLDHFRENPSSGLQGETVKPAVPDPLGNHKSNGILYCDGLEPRKYKRQSQCNLDLCR